MHPIPLLEEIAVVAGAAVAVVLLAGRLKLPTVAGLLLSGAMVGPHALGLVSDTHAIEVIAEVGVVLLLFTIGLEFSLARLRHIFRQVALGGVMQVGGTLGLVVAVALLLGAESGTALFYGFAVALSSTAIVLRALNERRELDAPHGRFIVGALIFQDLCVVPMVLIVPLLGSQGGAGGLGEIGKALALAAVVVVLVVGMSRLLVPRLMAWVDASRSREVFLLAVLSLCVGTAWLTSLAGLSLALGAFLGGVVVADTEYSHRAMGDMLPLRDVFVSFFFVSLGMLFDARALLERPGLIAALLVALIVGKGLIATVAALVMRFPPRAAWLAGVGLAQFGEFGFVLARIGTESGAIQPSEVEALLDAGIISMFLTPLILRGAPHITAGERLLAPLARLLRARSIEEVDTPEHALSDHVVVIGYGVVGRLVAATLRKVGVDHVILELNAENVRQGRAAGDPVFYADATSTEALGHAHVERARCIVVMINDQQDTRRVVDTVRRVAPDVPMVARTHYLADRQNLSGLGARRVVTEELEGGLEVLAQVMRELDVPRNVIEAEIRVVRESTGGGERRVTVPRNRWSETHALHAMKVESVALLEGAAAVGKTLRDVHLRATTGASVVAVQHDDDVQSHPEPDYPFAAGDIVYLLGESEAVQAAARLLSEGPEEESV